MATSNNPAHLPGERELVITRIFDAPRELVWKAFIEPDRLARWWGPKGFAMLVRTLDLRPGGIFHYSMRSPDGHIMWGYNSDSGTLDRCSCWSPFLALDTGTHVWYTCSSNRVMRETLFDMTC